MKKLIALIIAAVMILSMIPVMAISTSAADDGMWTTYRGAGNYPAIDDEPDEPGEETVYPPEAGYEYTSEGFSVIQPDWTGVGPFTTVSTVEAINLKDGLYLEFRVDDYQYGGEIGADHWICLTLNTGKTEDGATPGTEAGQKTGKVQPGNTSYGGGWLTLLCGVGDGNAQSRPHLTNPKTDDFGGTFTNDGGVSNITPALDDEGREIYTLEVTWTGSEYEIKVCGVVQGGQAATTTRLEALDPNGNFFVGITMMDGTKGSNTALTITKFGTSASDATKPVGTDSKEPGENVFVIPEPADPSTVPVNTPAILWSPDTVDIKSGYNCDFIVQGDNTWRVQATEYDLFFNFTPKRTWSYNAEDFPVFGILLRNFWMDTGTLRYAAGDVTQPLNKTVPFSVYDGEFYGADEEYIFIPVDLTGLWEGRINGVRIDVHISSTDVRGFDICFAGMFRSEEEAYAYAMDWLDYDYPIIETPSPTEPPYDPEIWDTMPETLPDEVITEIVSDIESILDTREGETLDNGQAVEDILQKYGCTGSLGAVTLLAVAAAALALSKKKE